MLLGVGLLDLLKKKKPQYPTAYSVHWKKIPRTNHQVELHNSGHGFLIGTCQMGSGHRGLLDQEDKQD